VPGQAQSHRSCGKASIVALIRTDAHHPPPVESAAAGLAVGTALGVAAEDAYVPSPLIYPASAAPTVLALPAPGENFALFQQHDMTCRQYASAQIGGQSPGQAAAQSGLASAAVAGALLGAASGYAGNGAAIGAGTGLLAGSMVGSASGRSAARTAQSSYNVSYMQCMVANGEHVEQPAPPPALVYRAPPPRVVCVAPPGYFVPPPPPPRP
jgi:hypothetical protein